MQRANRRKYHYIYKVTRDDGRFYIGMHSTDNLEDGYFGSGKLITRSIKKHGLNRHTKEILEYCESREQLKLREKFLITDEMRCDTLCMNIAPGGGGGFINEAHKLKAQKAAAPLGGQACFKNKKGWFSEESQTTRTATLNARYASGELKGSFTNRKHKDETKIKMSESARGKTKEQNSQYGTCWVRNEVKSIKIKIEKLDEYLAQGFIRGRKIKWS